MTAEKSKYSNPEGFKRAWRKSAEFLRPPPKYTPSQWSEANVKIPLGNAVPGAIRFANAPYQVEPLDMFADPDVERITLMWGAQLGKTQLLNCAMGYFIAHEPASQMMMQPSQGDLHTWLETKFNPMCETNEALRDRIAKPRSREGVNNQSMKSYPGGFLMFSWSGSARTMRGRSAPKIYCDEVDGYDYTAEGHPVSLLWQRAATFGDQRKLLVTSTPTIKGSSFVEKSYEDGDMRQFWIPCPHCNKEILLKWANIQWDKNEEGIHMPDTAFYACQECGSPISDTEKRMALRQGRWIAQKVFTGHASYHLNELYSGFRRWKDIVRSFLEKKATNDLQSFVNVSLAETWEENGEWIDDETLYGRREPMDYVPRDVLFITSGVDIQDNRIELSIVGWGRNDESWVIEHETLWGDPSTPHVWEALDASLMRTYQTEDGRNLGIRASAVDSGGHHTNAVYHYCKRNVARNIYAIKGIPGEGKPIAGRPTKSNSVKCNLFPIGVHTAKMLLLSRLKIDQPGGGYIHFSEKLDEEYFKQLTSEKLTIRYHRGYQKREFKKTRPRNEALDCYVYALASYTIANININAYADKLDQKAPETPAEEPKKAVKRQFVPRTGGNFVNSWR